VLHGLPLRRDDHGAVLISIVKSMVFGLIAGLVGCYRGLTV
jgi:ABC-type transporter Mla maintaining outer membrane lipid asymmetry permease subunit MlaE